LIARSKTRRRRRRRPAARRASTAEATDALQDATVIVLSSNQAFSNERLLRRGPGVTMVDTSIR
jgi:hypothetical protein